MCDSSFFIIGSKRLRLVVLPFLIYFLEKVFQKQARARSRWGAIANPHAKVFDSPSTPQSHPRA